MQSLNKFISRKSIGLLHRTFPLLGSASNVDQCNQIVSLLKPRQYFGNVVRIGGNGDGAYVVPDCLDGVKSSISPGVSREYKFDLELGFRGIKSFMYDASVSMPEDLTSMQQFHGLFIDTYNSSKTVRLEDVISNIGFKSESMQDLMLQMDIEGAEYRCINDLNQEYLNRFKIMILELHDFDIFANNQLYNKYWLKPFLNKLRCYHDVIHIHPNNQRETSLLHGIRFPNVIEVTLLHKDHWQNTTDRAFDTQTLDIVTNSSLPYLPLGKPWFDS